ncbi:MAG TPA: aminotransferase class III-fold pyridoxal phosphate-dependent enzyme [Gemmatimonadaceae bacterium]|nr:aminotransferase class III-fold pyridoxal phosphate-dependent enzyme [Gemmatimonadaceae bacterium]
MARIPGGTSTGSKRPDAMYGAGTPGPSHYSTAAGCRLTTTDGTELVDFTMALGSVAFGYADPDVTEAVIAAARNGTIAALPHTLEVTVAEQLQAAVPIAEQVRFLKSGAEGVAAAVRIARTHTQRSHVLACGYFGWLDWSSDAAGVPAATQALCTRIPFGDVDAAREAAAGVQGHLAAIVIEPVIERMAPVGWLHALRELCDDNGALFIADEIKTGFRVHPAGAVMQQGIHPDLVVFGKALANGYPLAAVAGRGAAMAAAQHTWISSTVACDTTALAAASAVLARHAREDVCAQLASIGKAMRAGAERAVVASGAGDVRVEGIDQMWLLRFDGDAREAQVLANARASGVLIKRGAYNFAALAHDGAALAALEQALAVALRSDGAAHA